MKNIHLIPTDKPSRLWINNLLQGKLELSKEMLIGSNTAQHIYITNSEEIKEGVAEWGFDVYENKIFFPVKDWKGLTKGRYKKIILTTDQDLIKDGVQSIDDEFLEWFVKNPSCEEVVIHTIVHKNHFGFDKDKINYKIIIPKEEPKQKSLVEKMIPLQLKYNLDMMKQETLEEAAERIYPTTFVAIFTQRDKVDKNAERRKIFIEGAKCQQERMYSEEEVKQIIDKTLIEYSDYVLADISHWFEQFKKKK